MVQPASELTAKDKKLSDQTLSVHTSTVTSTVNILQSRKFLAGLQRWRRQYWSCVTMARPDWLSVLFEYALEAYKIDMSKL